MKQLKTIEFKKKLAQGSIVVDTRDATDFTEGFIPGSIFIGHEGNMEDWATILLSKDKSIILVTSEGKYNEVAEKFSQNGYNKIDGILEGGFESWKNAGEKIDLVIDIEPDELAMDIPFDNNLTILDVRSFEEYSKSHVKDAINLPLSEMTDVAQIADFEEHQNLYIYSENGYRSVIAASLLKKEGYYSVRNIQGGFEKIKHEKSIHLEK